MTDEPFEQERIDRGPLIAVMAATGFAWFGNVLSLVVVPWLVYQVTGSGAQTGFVGFAAAAPLVLAGLFGGVLIDRVGHARSAFLSEVFSGIFLALIPILHLTIGLNVWAIAALVFISNLFSVPGMTARRTLIPEVAPRAGMPLERANSLEQMLSRFPQLLGPAVAGALMAVFHPANVIWLAVAVVWVSALFIRFGVRDVEQDTSEDSGSYLSDLVEGFRFLMKDPLIRTLAFILAFTNLLEAPLSVVMPIYAQEVFGSSVGLGVIMAALGIGLMIGVGLFAWIGDRVPRRLVFIGGLCGIGSAYWILTTLPGLWVASGVLLSLGILAGPVNPLLSTIFQERVPARMRGRVFGLIAAIALSMMPLGRLFGGVFVDWIGLSGTLLVQAIGFAAAGVVMVLLPSLKLLNEPQSPPGAAAEPQPAPSGVEHPQSS
jgi:MFS family permease